MKSHCIDSYASYTSYGHDKISTWDYHSWEEKRAQHKLPTVVRRVDILKGPRADYWWFRQRHFEARSLPGPGHSSYKQENSHLKITKWVLQRCSSSLDIMHALAVSLAEEASPHWSLFNWEPSRERPHLVCSFETSKTLESSVVTSILHFTWLEETLSDGISWQVEDTQLFLLLVSHPHIL